nr:hypothetical protein PJ912_15510 [Pectobacterium colocasium]
MLSGLHGALLPSPAGLVDRYRWLHEQAPYSVLAQGTGDVLTLFMLIALRSTASGYRESEMLALPSRLSAEASFRRTVAIEYHFSLT